jgi:HSP20 family protein
MTNLNLIRDKNPRYLTPWNQFFSDFDKFFRDFDQMLVPRESMLQSANEWRPGYELKETDKEYLMSFDLPGVKREHIEIEIQGDRLLVSAERKNEHHEDDSTHYLVQKSYGRFQKIFTLPEGVNREDIEANYEDGVLYLLVPKAKKQEAQKIKVGDSKGGFLQRLVGKKDEVNRDQAV